jgi:hypothetical protein
LHESGFGLERAADGTLCFARADGRTIPRFGYRLDDFVDDGAESPSAEGFTEVREPAAVYAIMPRPRSL